MKAAILLLTAAACFALTTAAFAQELETWQVQCLDEVHAYIDQFVDPAIDSSLNQNLHDSAHEAVGLGENFQMYFGEEASTDGVPHVLYVWCGTVFACEIPVEERQAMNIDAGIVQVNTQTRHGDPAYNPAFEIVDVRIDSVDRLDGSQDVTGAARIRPLRPAPDVTYSLRMGYNAEASTMSWTGLDQTIGDREIEVEFSLNSINAAGEQFAGTLPLFFDIVVIYQNDDGPDVVVYSRPVVVHAHVVMPGDAVQSGAVTQLRSATPPRKPSRGQNGN